MACRPIGHPSREPGPVSSDPRPTGRAAVNSMSSIESRRTSRLPTYSPPTIPGD